METLERWRLGERRTYKIYSRDEADDLGIKYTYWKKVREGDWGLTDDNYVMECFKRRDFDNGHAEIVLSGARSWNTSREIRWENRRKNHSWYEPTDEKWTAHEAKCKRIKYVAHAAATMLINGDRLDYEFLAKLYRPDIYTAPSIIKKILNEPRAIKMIHQEIEKALTENGVTLDYIIDLGKETVSKARNLDNVAEMGRMFERLVKLIEKNLQAKEIPADGSVIHDVMEDIQEQKKIGERTQT